MKPEACTIRPAQPADAARCIALRGRTRENAVPADQLDSLGITADTWAEGMESGRLCGHVAIDHGEMVGYAFGDTATGEVVVLALLPTHEGQGLGRELLGRVVHALRQAGHARLFLGCTRDPGARSHGFYRHLGWRPTGQTDALGDEVLELPALQGPAPPRHGGHRRRLGLAAVFIGLAALIGLGLWHEASLQAQLRRLRAELDRQPVSVSTPSGASETPLPLREDELRERVALRGLEGEFARRDPVRDACGSACRVAHTLLRSGDVVRDGERLTVLVFRSDEPPAGCTGCASMLSLFEFRKGLELASERIAFAALRPHDRLGEADVSLQQLTDADYALVLAFSDPAVPAIPRRLEIHRVTGAAVQPVFEQALEAHAEPAADSAVAAAAEWVAEWAFIEMPGAAPDLLLTRRRCPEGTLAARPQRYRLFDDGYRELPPVPPVPAQPAPPEPPGMRA